MDQLRLSPASRRLIDGYLARPGHAVLLAGPVGVGLGTIGRSLVSRLAGEAVIIIEPDDKGTIGIATIHELYSQTRSSRGASRLAVLIDDAEAMSQAAQNALLKLLEEPVDGVHFVLTSHQPSALLPTISSRLGRLDIGPLSDSDTKALLAEVAADVADQKKTQLLFMAAGRPAEIMRLVADEALFDKRAGLVRDARSMLSAEPYERVRLAYGYDKDRDQAIALLDTMLNLLKFATFRQRTLPDARLVDLIEEVIARLKQNGHVRTQLLLIASR